MLGSRWVWFVLAAAICALVLLPIMTLVWTAFAGTPSNQYTDNFGYYLSNTLLLLLGVGAVVITIGVICAWLITFFTFPLSRLLGWGLLLPLALPGYIAAYVYTDLLDYAGPVQSQLRELGGFASPRDYWFPSIRSLGGAILIMGLVLYPYVYLLMRTSLAEQSRGLYQAARILGMSHVKTAFRVQLPMARPALIAGASLAMLEAVGDFGTVDYFAVATLLTGTWDLWHTQTDLYGAARLALLLTVAAMVILLFERRSRKKRVYCDSRTQNVTKTKLVGWQSWLATLACSLPVIFGFALPVLVLLKYSVEYFYQSIDASYVSQLSNSLTIAAAAALLTITLGLLVVYAQRLQRNSFFQYTRVLCSLGYATPGAVLAIGVLFSFAAIDHGVNQLLNVSFGIEPGLLLSGSLAALVIALAIRFLAISASTIESSLSNISYSTDMAARCLGHNTVSMLYRYHLPLIRSGMLTAGLIVFVDSMKELPATLILRPLDFNTLATQAYLFAGDERMEIAALGCLSIVLPSTLAMLLVHLVEHKKLHWNNAQHSSGTAPVPAPKMIPSEITH